MPQNTPLRSYTYPTPDDPNDLAFITQRIAEQVEADVYGVVGSFTVVDTGWVSITSSAMPNLQARRIGQEVQIRGGLAGTYPTGELVLGALPASIPAPSSLDAPGSALLTGGTVGVSRCTIAGSISVFNPTGAEKNYALISIRYFVG